MSVITRSVTIQVRVVPAIKKGSERVLERIGLNMSEAIELFLRRLIVDERLPFEVVALEATQVESGIELKDDMETRESAKSVQNLRTSGGQSRVPKLSYRRKKKFKKFSGAQTDLHISGHKID